MFIAGARDSANFILTLTVIINFSLQLHQKKIEIAKIIDKIHGNTYQHEVAAISDSFDAYGPVRDFKDHETLPELSCDYAWIAQSLSSVFTISCVMCNFWKLHEG